MSNFGLRRADLLKLTDITARPFDALVARGQTPWPPRAAQNGWAEFTTEDAYKIALVHALVRQGKSYDDAARLVRAEFDDLANFKSEAPGDVLLGSFITESEPDDDVSVRIHVGVVATEAEWFATLQERRAMLGAGDHLVGFIAVNASEVMRRTLSKAVEADLQDAKLRRLAKTLRAS